MITAGIPVEILPGEQRIAILPQHLNNFSKASVKFLVERGLGSTIGVYSEEWVKYGAEIVELDELYLRSDIVIKVKEPQDSELKYYRKGQASCCFHHVAANVKRVNQLLKKGVVVLPFEQNAVSLPAMSREAGKRIPDILDQYYGAPSWKQQMIFLAGARGIVGRTVMGCFERDLEVSWKDQVQACDVAEGLFTTKEAPHLKYYTFLSDDNTQICKILPFCRIIILAARFPSGGAPKIVKKHHLDLLPPGAFIIQVAIDEGGNIDDEEFCKKTYIKDPVYEVRRNNKIIYVCNLPNIPGCIRPEQSTMVLSSENLSYYRELFESWPNVLEKYIFKGFKKS